MSASTRRRRGRLHQSPYAYFLVVLSGIVVADVGYCCDDHLKPPGGYVR